MKKKMLIGAIVPVVASLGLWLGLGGSSVAHATGGQAVTSNAEVTTGPDTDNIQSGDRSTPDTTATAEAGSGSKTGGQGSESSSASEGSGSESSGESGPSDGPGGHEDPPGNVNHECTGDCQE
jgi:hypothetical protein